MIATFPPCSYFHILFIERVGWYDDHDFLTIWPTQRPGVMVEWSKNFDHDHGQNLTITMVKWSILTIDHGQNRGCHGQFFTIDHCQKNTLSYPHPQSI